MKFQDKLLAVLTIVLIFGVFIGITVWTHPQSYNQFLMALGDIGRQIWAGIVILFWVGLGLGVLSAITHILREHRLVRPGKYGAVQAIHKGRETIVLSASQLDEQEQMEKLFKTMVTMQKAYQGSTRIIEAPQEPAQPLPLPLPRIPEQVRYEDVSSQVAPGQALLGVDETGVKTCEFGQILTCLILGGSGTGKSNTISIKVEEAIRDGWKIVLVDPHKRKPESLYNRIKEYSDDFLKFPGMEDGVAQNEEEIKQVFTWFLGEFQARLDGKGQEYDVLIICDEVGNIADSEDDEVKHMLKKIARTCGNESRDFGMAGWFINQNPVGIAWLRNVVMTVITHKVNMMNQRLIACNDDRELARKMDNFPKGRVYVYGLFIEGVHEFQMPIKQQRVVDSTATSRRKSTLSDTPSRLPFGEVPTSKSTEVPTSSELSNISYFNQPYKPFEVQDETEIFEDPPAQKKEADHVDMERVARVASMMADSKSVNSMIAEEWGITKPGGAYQKAVAELREVQRVIAKRAMAG